MPSPELVVVGTLAEAQKKFREIADKLGLKTGQSKFLLVSAKVEIELCCIVENKVYQVWTKGCSDKKI